MYAPQSARAARQPPPFSAGGEPGKQAFDPVEQDEDGSGTSRARCLLRATRVENEIPTPEIRGGKAEGEAQFPKAASGCGFGRNGEFGGQFG